MEDISGIVIGGLKEFVGSESPASFIECRGSTGDMRTAMYQIVALRLIAASQLARQLEWECGGRRATERWVSLLGIEHRKVSLSITCST